MQIHPLEALIIRAKCKRRPVKPFSLFATLSQLKELLDGTGLDPEVVKSHSKELTPGFWMFTIASQYHADTVRRSLGLVSIANALPVVGSNNLPASTCNDSVSAGGVEAGAKHFCGDNCRCAILARGGRSA